MADTIGSHSVVLNAEVDGLVAGMRQGTGAINAFHREQGKAAASFQTGSKAASEFGRKIQGTGYQLQDLLVQVSGGQNVANAIAAQGSQWLGMFGPAGAVAGAALAIGGLAFNMSSFAKSQDEGTVKSKTQIEALQGLIKAHRELDLIANKSKERNYLLQDVEVEKGKEKKAGKEFAASRAVEAIGLAQANKGGITNRALGYALQWAAGTKKAQMALTEANTATEEAKAKVAAYNETLREARKETSDLYKTETQINNDRAKEMNRLASSGQMGSTKYEQLRKQTTEYSIAVALATTENERFGEKGWVTLARLREEMSGLGKDTIEYQHKLSQGKGIFKGYEDTARQLKEQLDPMKKLKREAEEIGNLSRVGLLTPEETALAINQLAKPPALPQSLQVNAGASALGGTVGDGGPLLQIQQKMASDMHALLEAARAQLRLFAGV